MSAPTACGACGARVRAEWATCARCLLPLHPAPADDTPSSGIERRTTWRGVAIAALVTIVIGGWWTRETPHPQPLATTSSKPNPPPAPVVVKGPVRAVERTTVEPHLEGAVAYGEGRYETALERYQAAIASNPDDAESLSNLGQVLVRLGKVEEAVPCFDRAIALVPQRWAHHFNRARALSLLGRTADAVAGYRDALRLFPNDYVTAFNLGLALHKLGDEAGAVEAYGRAIDLDPADATFRLALGMSLERLQRPGDAAIAYDDYLRLAPDAPDAVAVRARITVLTQPPAISPAQPGS